jgi:proteasome component ECM29
MFRSNASSSSLLRCFFESVFQERGGKAAQDKMNAAFGSLASLCPGTAVRSLASSASERYKESHGNNDDAATRQAAAMVLRSVAVKASNQFSDPGNSDVWCKKVLPVSFLGMRDPDTSVASLWKEVWEDGGSSVNLGSEGDDGNTIDEKLLLGLTKESVKALGDVSWTRRVTGAAAIADLSHRGILSPPPRRLNDETFQMEYGRARKRAQASRLALSSLVRLVARSRIWSGKNEVVRAIANLAIAWIPFAGSKEAKVLLGDPELAPISFGNVATDKDLFFGDSWFADSNVLHDENIDGSDQDEAFQTSDGSASDEVLVVLVVGLCRLLLVQAFPGDGALRAVAEEEVLPYRSDVLQSFERLLKSLPDDISGIPLRERIFSFVAPRLSVVFSNYSTNESPLIVARTVDCFAGSFWSHMRFEKDGESALDSVELSLLFLHHVDFSKQPAWTVREAAAKASGRIVQCANIATLRHGKFVSSFVDVASVALKDRKFWKVRLAGLQVLYAIVLRSGKRVAVGNGIVETAQEKQLILESILPHKESIQDLAKRSLHDSEAQVTALATKILSILSTWP